MHTHLSMRSIPALTFVALLSIAFPRQASAAPILDQSCCGGTTNLFASITDLTRAQTFTVGATGVLTSADVLLSLDAGSGTVQFDIIPGFGNGATVAGLGAPLTSYTLNWSATAPEGYVNLDFADLAVTAGDVLAIVMRPVTAGLGQWSGYTLNPYAGGEALTTSFGTTTFTNNIFGSSDFGFRTYVDAAPTPVPEPATLTLLGSAIGGMLARRYRRRN